MPPKTSELRREPACAWLTAGKTGIDQRCNHLPCLHKDVLRKAIKTWIAVHFFPPCSGADPADPNAKLNFMEHFTAFVWAHYTMHHKPKIPALTNVGRFIFAYMWRMQHPLMT
jgi:hypothetical protein